MNNQARIDTLYNLTRQGLNALSSATNWRPPFKDDEEKRLAGQTIGQRAECLLRLADAYEVTMLLEAKGVEIDPPDFDLACKELNRIIAELEALPMRKT